MQETLVQFMGQEEPLEKGKTTHSSICGFPLWLKESACNAGDPGSIPGLGISLEEGKGYPLQYSGLENPMDCMVHGVTKSQSWLSNFHFRGGSVVKNLPAMQETQEWWVWSLCWEDPLEEDMATHSSILAWENPRDRGPAGLQSTGLQSQTRLSNWPRTHTAA